MAGETEMKIEYNNNDSDESWTGTTKYEVAFGGGPNKIPTQTNSTH